MKYMLLAYTNVAAWESADVTSEDFQAMCGIQPSSPRLNMLIGCRVRSYPSRVRTWIATVVANTGPATRPQSSRRRVALVLFSDVCGVIVPVVTAPGVADV